MVGVFSHRFYLLTITLIFYIILSVISLNKETLEKYLTHKLNITVFDEIPSTNTYLKNLGTKAKEGTLIIADSQTEGKGRMGRSFYSQNGCGAYFSILLKPQISAEKSLLLTCMTAVAVADVVKKYTIKDVKIKWVNDIYIDGKKVCGILTEGSINADKMLDFAVIGIGINVFTLESDFPDDIKNIATSLFPGKTEEGIKEKIVAEIINNMLEMYYGNDTSFIEKYKDYSYLTGKKINIIKCDTVESATVLEIDDNCHLTVKTENGEIKTISSGDVSVRVQ